jgi:hypothetical protein
VSRSQQKISTVGELIPGFKVSKPNMPRVNRVKSSNVSHVIRDNS